MKIIDNNKIGEILFKKLTTGKNYQFTKKRADKPKTFLNLLQEIIANNQWEEKISAIEIINEWEKIVGVVFAQNVKALREENKVLYVECANQSWKMQVKINKQMIIKKIEQNYGKNLIVDIKTDR